MSVSFKDSPLYPLIRNSTGRDHGAGMVGFSDYIFQRLWLWGFAERVIENVGWKIVKYEPETSEVRLCDVQTNKKKVVYFFFLCSCFSTKQGFRSTSFIWFSPGIILLMRETSLSLSDFLLMFLLRLFESSQIYFHIYFAKIYFYFILCISLLGPEARLQPLDACKVDSSISLPGVGTLTA